MFMFLGNNFAWRLFTLCLVSSGLMAASVPKCCPSGRRIHFSLFGGAASCQNTTALATALNLNNEDDESRIPACSGAESLDRMNVSIGDWNSVPKDACFDYSLDGSELLGVFCVGPDGGVREAREGLVVKECCRKGYSYEPVSKECVLDRDNSTLDGLLERSGGHFGFYSPLKCNTSGILVEYNSFEHNITLTPDSLRINLRRVILNMSARNFCITKVAGGQENAWIARVCHPKTICKWIPCVGRCCADGEKMAKNKNKETVCVRHSKLTIQPQFYEIYANPRFFEPNPVNVSIYGVSQIQKCSRFILNPDRYPEETHYLNHRSGTLHVLSTKIALRSQEEYCMDYLEMPGSVHVQRTFSCFPNTQTKHRIEAIGISISAFFLGLTLLIYGCLPKLLNLHGKTLVCHVASMFCACTLLAIVKIVYHLERTTCFWIGNFFYFFIMAAFTWLNIMCFDIWWTFGSVQARGFMQTRERRRFIWYSAYAWGLALTLTLITYLCDRFQLVPEVILPNIGKEGCWFRPLSGGHVVFFCVPVGILAIINTVLFVLTLIHCNKVKAEISRMQGADDSRRKRFVADKAKLAMNAKLFIVMGVSWILEIISTLFPEPMELWYFTDVLNMLQGVFIFFIFVVKRKVYVALKGRLGFKEEDSRATATTGVTSGRIKSGSFSTLNNYSVSNATKVK